MSARTVPGRACRSALAMLLATAACIGCFSDRPTGAGSPALDCSVPLDAPGPNEVLVAIRNFAFQPAELEVEVGTTVTWVNCEDAGEPAHTTTSDTGVWGSPLLAPAGGTFSFTFTGPGRFAYHCEPHPFMQGVIDVVR